MDIAVVFSGEPGDAWAERYGDDTDEADEA
jgi:hypothetical protein